MPDQLIATAIMFLLTVLISAVIMLPAKMFSNQGPLFRFYWKGFWAILSTIAAISGSQATLNIAGYNVDSVAEALLTAMTLVLVLFVMFAWGRLVLTGAFTVIKNRLGDDT